MAEKLLSDRKCQSARIIQGETLLADGGNLYLRIRPQGKDWLFIYRLDGKQPKLGLGSYPDVTLAEARDLALEARKLLAQGTDPRAHRKAQEEARRAASAISQALPQTVKDLFEEWHRRDLSRRRADGGTAVERAFKKDVLPEIGNLPLSAVRRAHITQLLDKIADRGVTRTVGVVLADLRQMFAFGQIRDLLPTDPTFGLKKASWHGIAQERDRVLSDPEIMHLSKALPTSDLIEESQHGIWIMLATLARVGELSKAQWPHLDLDVGTWTIPAENAKNGIEHVINLSQFARKHFLAIQRKAKASAKKAKRKMSSHVFPARRHQGHVCVKTMAKQISDRQRGDAEPMSRRSPQTSALLLPGGKWTPHDLRRTGATIMGNLGIRPDVIEKCLNHVEQNRMKRIYQRQELRPEMTHAWSLLGSHLEALTGAA